MFGRRARHVNLDENAKVLYCTADTHYARTGIAGVLSHPEIMCDEAHADILIPYVGPAMKKVKKTSADRDQVPECCLTVVRWFHRGLGFGVLRFRYTRYSLNSLKGVI